MEDTDDDIEVSNSNSSESHGLEQDPDSRPDEQSQPGPLAIVSLSGRVVKKRKRESWVFVYFQLDPNRNRMACAVERCTKTYSKSTATGTLALHLKKDHNISNAGDEQPVIGDMSQTTFSKNGSSLVRHNVLSDDARADIFQALVLWVVDDKQAFQVVEKASFKNLVSKLNKNFSVPARRTLCRGLVEEYHVGEQEFRAIVESIPGRVAITCDGWSSRVMRGFFVITLHWIDTDWKLRSAVLEFIYFPPPHNQFTTSELILSVLKNYNLNTKIREVTTDSGSEMPPAMNHVRGELNQQLELKLTGDWHIRCVCHIMNRTVIDCGNLVKIEVEKVRIMLKTVRNCVPMRQEFKQIQVRLGRPVKSIVEVPNLDVENRWNSMFTMIDKCFVQQDVFETFSNMDTFYGKIVTLTNFEWRQIKAIRDFLEPAYKLTNVLYDQHFLLPR